MARTRTTKKLAQRIDLNYFKRPTPLKRAKFWLSVLAPVLALAWIFFHFFVHDPRVYSSGRLSTSHAVLERECSVCHLQKAGEFSAAASDAACLSCHDGPMHHAGLKKQLTCPECHTEHRGQINISAAADQACAACHSDLRAGGGTSNYANHILNFEDGHPEFTALRPVAGAQPFDPGTIKLNHAMHMKPIRVGPTGPIVQLECSDCHRPTAAETASTYADARYTSAKTSYSQQDEFLAVFTKALSPPKPATGREWMAPSRFAWTCAKCHLLTFDKRFEEGVPHDKPEVVHAYLVKKFAAYIAAPPAEVRVVRDPSRDLTGKPPPPAVRVLTPAQWVAEQTADAEGLLWRKTCKQCHTLFWPQKSASRRIPLAAAVGISAGNPPDTDSTTPGIAPAMLTLRWLNNAKFDHDAHRGFSCVGCHQKALSSRESSDILIPGIAVCQKCHAPGPDHAESRCFECHTYHDWSKRKEVKPTFTLPALRTGAIHIEVGPADKR